MPKVDCQVENVLEFIRFSHKIKKAFLYRTYIVQAQVWNLSKQDTTWLYKVWLL